MIGLVTSLEVISPKRPKQWWIERLRGKQLCNAMFFILGLGTIPWDRRIVSRPNELPSGGKPVYTFLIIFN